jgi:hypothetical protein
MGLNAVVYRNREHLPFDPEKFGAAFDERTGEYYAQKSKAADFDEDTVVALSRRLGNVGTIDGLAEAVQRSLGPNSLLQSKVLFSGTHAGDVIEVDSLDRLTGELAEVRSKTRLRPEPLLSEFVRSMEELVEAALYEGNPIVFT